MELKAELLRGIYAYGYDPKHAILFGDPLTFLKI